MKIASDTKYPGIVKNKHNPDKKRQRRHPAVKKASDHSMEGKYDRKQTKHKTGLKKTQQEQESKLTATRPTENKIPTHL